MVSSCFYLASALLGVDVNDLGTSLVTGTAFHKGTVNNLEF